MTIWALKGPSSADYDQEEYSKVLDCLSNSIRKGTSRFGWGYIDTGLASIKRTEKLSHMVSCFGVRSQLGKSSPARCECAGGCRSTRYNRRSRCALGSDWQRFAGRPDRV